MNVTTTYKPVESPIESVSLACSDTPSDKLVITRAYDGDTAFRLKATNGRVLFSSRQDLRAFAQQLVAFADQEPTS